MLYAGNNLDKARRIFERTQASAAHPADDPPAHASVGRSAVKQQAAAQPAASTWLFRFDALDSHATSLRRILFDPRLATAVPELVEAASLS